MKTLIALASAGASMATATMPAECASLPPICIPMRGDISANSSRPFKVYGERLQAWVETTSNGIVEVRTYDLRTIKNAVVLNAIPSILQALQVTQSPVDREIQKIVSANFESYWD